MVDVGCGQGGGGFIENENVRIARQRFGDFDHLPARQRQVLHRASGWMSLAPARASAFSAIRRCARRSMSPKRPRRIADGDVVGHSQVRHQRKFLEDADDTGTHWPPPGEAKRHRRPSMAIRPSSGCDHTGHDLDQGGFAGAVLAQDRVDPAGLDLKIGAPESLNSTDSAWIHPPCERKPSRWFSRVIRSAARAVRRRLIHRTIGWPPTAP